MRNETVYQLALIAINASSIQAVAEKIGYSRPALSRYMNNSYGAAMDKIEMAIKAHLDTRICPHSSSHVTLDYCKTKALTARPIKSGGAREAQWLACQSCKFKPNNLGVNNGN